MHYWRSPVDAVAGGVDAGGVAPAVVVPHAAQAEGEAQQLHGVQVSTSYYSLALASTY